ncbi:MAG: GIN domain-containing protein [Actinomycetota bacterium]
MGIKRAVLIGLVAALPLSGCITFSSRNAEQESRIKRLEDALEHGERSRGRDGEPGRPGRDGEPGRPGRPGRNDIHVVGSGVAKTETRPVSGISEVSIRGSATLMIDQTGTESLQVEAEDNLLEHLRSDVVGRRLELGLKPGVSIESTRPIIFRLTVARLAAVQGSGSGEIDIKALSGDSIEIGLSGSFDIKAAGSVTRQSLNISGSGDYSAEGLDSKEAQVQISGSGEAVVKVADKLDVSVRGSGSVRYSGSPRISRDIRGSGSVERAG